MPNPSIPQSLFGLSPLFGMSHEELTALMASLGEKPFRARQLFDALYRQRAASLDSVTTLSADLRNKLAQTHTLGLPTLATTARSVDGTERYLVQLADGETVETVWMPDDDLDPQESASEAPRATAADEEDGTADGKAENRGQGSPAFRRSTICVSSQIGCAVNCQFCLTAKLGIRRNLTPGEIAGQVAAVLNRHNVQLASARGNNHPARINLVFMGQGEPFLNYDNFMAAVRLLVNGLGIPESRMTVSTSGIEPAIRRFALEPIRPRLALSLNASNDTVRAEIMPITRKWNIAALLDACETLPLRTREWVTFEYVLLGGINDQPEHARELLALLGSRRALSGEWRSKVNLIVWNPGPGIPYTQPDPARVTRFQQTLIAAGLPTYIRRPRGRDIYAACGQLKRTLETTPHPELLAGILPAATPATTL